MMSWREKAGLFVFGSFLLRVGLWLMREFHSGAFGLVIGGIVLFFGGSLIWVATFDTRELKTYTLSSPSSNAPRIWNDKCPLTASEMIYLFKLGFRVRAQPDRALLEGNRYHGADIMMASAYFWLEDNGYISLSVTRREVEDLFLGFRYQERNIDDVWVTRKDQAPSFRIRANSLENKIFTHLTGDEDRESAYFLTCNVIGPKYTKPKKVIENRVRYSLVNEGYIQKSLGLFSIDKRETSRMDELEEFINPTARALRVLSERGRGARAEKKGLYSFYFEDHWTNTVSTTRDGCSLFIKKRKITTMENSSYIRVDGLPSGSTKTVRHSDLIKNILLTILIGWAWYHPVLSLYR